MLEKAAIEGLLMICANGHVRQCNPIIVGMSVNYEEQVVTTGIKSGCNVLFTRSFPKNVNIYAKNRP